MKKLLPLLLFPLLLLAEESSEEPSRSLWDYHPLHLGGNGIWIGSADLTPKRQSQAGSLLFQKANAYWFMLFPVSETTYFFPRVEWNRVTLQWDQNPLFSQTHFYYLQFGLMLYSTAIEKWRWIARYDYNLDLHHFDEPGSYGLHNVLLWGAYNIHPKWHYHVGFTGYAGLKGEMVYPIIGADYLLSEAWTIALIFPIDYSIQYKPVSWCRLSLKGRPLKERLKTGSQEAQPRSIFNYSSMGTEFNIHFEKERRFEAEIYGGYNFGGTFYIKNDQGKNAQYASVGGGPYIGGNLDYAF